MGQTNPGNVSGNSSPGNAQPSAPKPEAELKCSYCGKPFFRSETKHMPFCTKRCQQVDLGMWLNESYGFPTEGESTVDNFGIEEDDPWSDDP
ncbi:MAG: DNA gyrase inhibitor YacG [Mariniblastus sp.]